MKLDGEKTKLTLATLDNILFKLYTPRLKTRIVHINTSQLVDLLFMGILFSM